MSDKDFISHWILNQNIALIQENSSENVVYEMMTNLLRPQ